MAVSEAGSLAADGRRALAERKLDAEVLLMFSALFEKSGQPQNYLLSLQQFDQATHDFRLLAVLADSIVGLDGRRKSIPSCRG